MPRHSVSRHVKCGRELLFNLVADVERYPEFVPWWMSATVWKTDADTYYTRQTVGMSLIYHEFQSQTTIYRPDRIQVISRERPFRSLDMHWSFEVPAHGGCNVHLNVEYELRSMQFGMLAAIISADGVRRLVDAFEGRAYHLGRRAAGSHVAEAAAADGGLQSSHP
ncbi:MAG: type II toxin-antitoxin system RatA family toxin [Alphaproteobacteria bacterium]|nr:type II toxin-antitoxin system RatA family toxin [Alphaproteobacteria bacterium]